MNPVKNNSVICFGEILWDILPGKELPGGAPMNVAYHLHKLGIDPVLITRIGDDERGRKLLHILKTGGLNTDSLQTDPAVPTGIVYAQANKAGEMSYDIVKPAAWDHIELSPELQEKAAKAAHFVFGSLSTRSVKTRKTLMALLEAANHKILDINLRTPFYDAKTVAGLLRKADVVKMNLEELQLITGWFAPYKDTEDQMQFIQDSYDLESVIVTKGGDGAVVNYKGDYFRHGGIKVKVADTIGSGDSFLAAFLFSIMNGEPPENALHFATALGALVASKSGAWPDYEINEIKNLSI